MLDENRIQQKGSKWCVFSKDGQKNLGCGPDEEWAKRRLASVILVTDTIIDSGYKKSLASAEIDAALYLDLGVGAVSTEAAEILKHMPGKHDQKQHRGKHKQAKPTQEELLTKEEAPEQPAQEVHQEPPRNTFREISKIVNEVKGPILIASEIVGVALLLTETPGKIRQVANSTSNSVSTASNALSKFFSHAKNSAKSGWNNVETEYQAIQTASSVSEAAPLIGSAADVIKASETPFTPSIEEYSKVEKGDSKAVNVAPDINKLTAQISAMSKRYDAFVQIINKLHDKKLVKDDVLKKTTETRKALDENIEKLRSVLKPHQEQKHLAGQHDQRKHGKVAAGAGPAVLSKRAQAKKKILSALASAGATVAIVGGIAATAAILDHYDPKNVLNRNILRINDFNNKLREDNDRLAEQAKGLDVSLGAGKVYDVLQRYRKKRLIMEGWRRALGDEPFRPSEGPIVRSKITKHLPGQHNQMTHGGQHGEHAAHAGAHGDISHIRGVEEARGRGAPIVAEGSTEYGDRGEVLRRNPHAGETVVHNNQLYLITDEGMHVPIPGRVSEDLARSQGRQPEGAVARMERTEPENLRALHVLGGTFSGIHRVADIAYTVTALIHDIAEITGNVSNSIKHITNMGNSMEQAGEFAHKVSKDIQKKAENISVSVEAMTNMAQPDYVPAKKLRKPEKATEEVKEKSNVEDIDTAKQVMVAKLKMAPQIRALISELHRLSEIFRVESEKPADNQSEFEMAHTNINSAIITLQDTIREVKHMPGKHNQEDHAGRQASKKVSIAELHKGEEAPLDKIKNEAISLKDKAKEFYRLHKDQIAVAGAIAGLAVVAAGGYYASRDPNVRRVVGNIKTSTKEELAKNSHTLGVLSQSAKQVLTHAANKTSELPDTLRHNIEAVATVSANRLSNPKTKEIQENEEARIRKQRAEAAAPKPEKEKPAKAATTEPKVPKTEAPIVPPYGPLPAGTTPNPKPGEPGAPVPPEGAKKKSPKVIISYPQSGEEKKPVAPEKPAATKKPAAPKKPAKKPPLPMKPYTASPTEPPEEDINPYKSLISKAEDDSDLAHEVYEMSAELLSDATKAHADGKLDEEEYQKILESFTQAKQLVEAVTGKPVTKSKDVATFADTGVVTEAELAKRPRDIRGRHAGWNPDADRNIPGVNADEEKDPTKTPMTATLELKKKIKKSIIEKTIVKRGKQWCVVSKKDPGRNLGCSPNRGGAVKRLQQVEYFKHAGAHKSEVENQFTLEIPDEQIADGIDSGELFVSDDALYAFVKSYMQDLD